MSKILFGEVKVERISQLKATFIPTSTTIRIKTINYWIGTLFHLGLYRQTTKKMGSHGRIWKFQMNKARV